MRHDALAVLGIDAAWTEHQPSGIALLTRGGSRWRCQRVAPSYAAFCKGFRWSDSFDGSSIDVESVLRACQECIGNADLIAIAVDMPLAATRIDKRRQADDLISRQFGHCKCAVHSPTIGRPGAVGRRLHEGFSRARYGLALAHSKGLPALLEVYPHIALLGLTGRPNRLCYKAGKTNTYWAGQSAEDRKRKLVDEWRFILDQLAGQIDDIDLPLPDPVAHSFEYLKRFEDAIDGLICAWVAIQFVNKAAVPVGDDSAAIWIPASSMQFAKEIHGTKQKANRTAENNRAVAG